MAATPPPRSKTDPHQIRRAPETVTTEGTWCCVARSVAVPTTPRRLDHPKSKEFSKVNETSSYTLLDDVDLSFKENQKGAGNRVENQGIQKNDKRQKSGDLIKAGEVLKTGEIAALIKQGFISASSVEKSGSGSPFRIRLSPGRVSPIVEPSSLISIPPAVCKFNSFINTDPRSPSMISSPPVDKIRSSPSLFDMMVHEQRKGSNALAPQSFKVHANSGLSKQFLIQERLMSSCSPGNQFNDASSSDVKLTLSNKAGISVDLNLHRHILASHSQFFSAKLSERRSMQQCLVLHRMEISDCDDIELYVETLRLMYCKDLKRKLMKENVSRVLGILKVSAEIVFEAGLLSCLEYLEAVPWAEEDETKVISILSQLQLDSIGVGDVTKRLSIEDRDASEDILVHLLQSVTTGTDEKARREMKNLVSRMLRENAAQTKDHIDISTESMYCSCNMCLDVLLHLFMQASSSDSIIRGNEDRGLLVAQIARQADNLHWLVDILIDRQIADEFVRLWAYQAELATLHSQIPTMFRYEVSRLTSRLCIAIGKGEVIVPKETRFMLLQNWLQPLIDDFAWMQRACKGLDRKVVEDGICQTISTLPLKQQETIMIGWFDQFLKNGDNCPNLQKAFEVWWRRAFVRRYTECEQTSPSNFFSHST
eukprot:c25341_g1_i1 orf=907-2862(+)